MLCPTTGKLTAKKVVRFALTTVLTGLFFAAGYDIYSRLFKKAA